MFEINPVKNRIQDLSERTAVLRGIFDYDAKKERLEEVNAELEQPDVWNEPERAQALGKERAALEAIVETIDQLEQGGEDVGGLLELAVEADDEETFNEAVAELDQLMSKLDQLEFRRMFSGEYDSADCYRISVPVPAAPKRRTGPACCCACTCAGLKPRASRPK